MIGDWDRWMGGMGVWICPRRTDPAPLPGPKLSVCWSLVIMCFGCLGMNELSSEAGEEGLSALFDLWSLAFFFSFWVTWSRLGLCLPRYIWLRRRCFQEYAFTEEEEKELVFGHFYTASGEKLRTGPISASAWRCWFIVRLVIAEGQEGDALFC